MTEWKSLTDQSSASQFRDFVIVGGLKVDVTTTTDPLSALIQNMENLKDQVLVTYRNSGCYDSLWPEFNPITNELVKPNTAFARSENSFCDSHVHKAIMKILAPEQWNWLRKASKTLTSNRCSIRTFADIPTDYSKDPCAPAVIEGLFKELSESPSPAKGSAEWKRVREVTYDMSYYLRKLQKEAEKALEKTGNKSIIKDGWAKFKIKFQREFGGAIGAYFTYALIKFFLDFLGRQRLMERCTFTYGFDLTISEFVTTYVTLCGDEGMEGQIFEWGVKPANYIYLFLFAQSAVQEKFIYSYKKEAAKAGNKNTLVSFECAWKNYFLNKSQKNYDTELCRTVRLLPYDPSKVLVRKTPVRFTFHLNGRVAVCEDCG